MILLIGVLRIFGSNNTAFNRTNELNANPALVPLWGQACVDGSVVISFDNETRTFEDLNFTVTAASNQLGIPITYSIADKVNCNNKPINW